MQRLLVMVVVALVASVARAETEDAKALFEKATVQFRIGQFHEAAETYKHVYELHHDPSLLYNAAQAYRLGNEPEKALLFYRSFLSSAPDTPQRAEVEGRIAELERIVSEQKKAKERPPNEVKPTPLPPTETQPATTAAGPPESAPPAQPQTASDAGRSKKIAGIVLLGIGAGALIGGIVTAVLSGQASDSINAAARTGQAFDPAKESAGKTDTIVSGVMFGVGGAAVVAGAVVLGLAIRDGRAREHKVSIAPILSPTVAGMTACVHF
jgi:tetratricopeptide (TPR) repeat protein